MTHSLRPVDLNHAPYNLYVVGYIDLVTPMALMTHSLRPVHFTLLPRAPFWIWDVFYLALFFGSKWLASTIWIWDVF